MHYKLLSFLLLFCFLVAGCAQQVTSIKKDVDLPLESGMGYLLIGIETNFDLDSVFIEGPDYLKLTRDDLRRGTNYFLIDLPAGEYSFEKIKLNRWWKMELSEGYWDFEVVPNKISYVGHLQVKGAGWFAPSKIVLENRSSQAYVFLQDEFPNILDKREITYEGPGEDPFLYYVQKGFFKEDVK